MIKAQDCMGHGLLLNNCGAQRLWTCMAPCHIWHTAKSKTHRQALAHLQKHSQTHTKILFLLLNIVWMWMPTLCLQCASSTWLDLPGMTEVEHIFYTPVIFGRHELAVPEWQRQLPSQRSKGGKNQMHWERVRLWEGNEKVWDKALKVKWQESQEMRLRAYTTVPTGAFKVEDRDETASLSVPFIKTLVFTSDTCLYAQ